MIDNRALSGVALALFAIVVSAALLSGGLDSRAEFSDSVRLGRNELVAGVVDLAVGSSTTPVVVDNLAPGDQSLLALELRNDGTLPLLVTTELADAQPPIDTAPPADLALTDSVAGGEGDGGPASDSELTIRSWLSESDCRAEDGPVDSSDSGEANEPESAGEHARLAAGETGQLCLSVDLPLSATNSAQGKAHYFTIIVTGTHDYLSNEPDPAN